MSPRRLTVSLRTLSGLIGLAACLLAGSAFAGPLSLTYRGKTTLATSSTTDQNGNSFTVAEMSGITYRGGSDFTAVMNVGGKLVDLSVTFNANGSIQSANMTGGHTLASSGDFEGIAYTNAGRNSVFISDEDTTSVYEYTLGASGAALPPTIGMPAVFGSVVANRSLESLSRRADGQEMWTANEEALTADGSLATASAGTLVRLQHMTASGDSYTPDRAYAYLTEPIHAGIGSPNRSGLSDLVVLPNGTLLALERSALVGLPTFESRIYEVDYSAATDISQAPYASGLSSQSFTGVTKTQLYRNTEIGENLEGLCLGPQLPSGNWVLLGVVDDGDALSNNTLVAFELVGVVPEPSALVLAGLGVLTLAATRLLRRLRIAGC